MAILYELAPPPYNIETAPKHSTIQKLQVQNKAFAIFFLLPEKIS